MEEPKIINNNIVNQNKSELWNLSFRDLFFKYVRFLPVFVLSVAFALLGAYLYLRYTVPIYQVGGSIIIKSDQAGGRNDKVEELFAGNRTQNIQNEIEILKSKPLMQRVVDKLNLQFSYYAIGKIKTVNVYRQGAFIVNTIQLIDSSKPFSFKVKILNRKEFTINKEQRILKFGEAFKTSSGIFSFSKNYDFSGGNDYNVIWSPTASAASSFAGALQIFPKSPNTGILSITMKTPNAQLAADIINKLMEEYGNYSIEQKKQSSDQILTFIDDRLIDYGRKLDSVQKMYLSFQTKYNLIDAETQQGTYFDVISQADKSSNEQTISLNVAGMLDDYLSDKKNEFNKVVVPSTLGIEDATLNELVSNYNKAQIGRQELLDANIPPENPLVKEANGQIEKLRLSIKENLRNIKSSGNQAISRFKERSNIGETQ